MCHYYGYKEGATVPVSQLQWHQYKQNVNRQQQEKLLLSSFAKP